MPIEVIDQIGHLSFNTVDGAAHSYKNMGVRLFRAPANTTLTDTLTVFTSMAGYSVEITAIHSYLSVYDGATDVTTKTRIELPKVEEVSRRRRHLSEHAENDLNLRCHPTKNVCLHTFEEIGHLHGHNSRFLAEGDSATTSAAAYAIISKDAYSISSNTGSVSWTLPGGDVISRAPIDFGDDLGEAVEYDEWGCIVEEGFVTLAYPLTTKHCFKWISVSFRCAPLVH
jgi:hypothetical protein